MVPEGISVWVPVISALSGGLLAGAIALTGIWMTHHFTRKREQEAAERKLAADRYFIVTELVFTLEDYAETCATATYDDGIPDGMGFYHTSTTVEPISFESITGDWRALPASIMYRVRELIVLQSEAREAIANTEEDDFVPKFALYFRERQYQYARLGLRALLLAKRLRKITGMPASRLDKYTWSPQNAMWQTWRRERKSRNRIRQREANE